jgi:hypothetical protein
MIKSPYSKIPLMIAFLALMIALPSGHVNAGPIDKLIDSSTSSACTARQTDINALNQSESPGLMAQAEAQAAGENPCVRHCRDQYKRDYRECRERGHRHHRCEEMARRHEDECLEHCHRRHHDYDRKHLW